jgi:hypothetical protein
MTKTLANFAVSNVDAENDNRPNGASPFGFFSAFFEAPPGRIDPTAAELDRYADHERGSDPCDVAAEGWVP